MYGQKTPVLIVVSRWRPCSALHRWILCSAALTARVTFTRARSVTELWERLAAAPFQHTERRCEGAVIRYGWSRRNHREIVADDVG